MQLHIGFYERRRRLRAEWSNGGRSFTTSACRVVILLHLSILLPRPLSQDSSTTVGGLQSRPFSMVVTAARCTAGTATPCSARQAAKAACCCTLCWPSQHVCSSMPLSQSRLPGSSSEALFAHWDMQIQIQLFLGLLRVHGQNDILHCFSKPLHVLPKF